MKKWQLPVLLIFLLVSAALVWRLFLTSEEPQQLDVSPDVLRVLDKQMPETAPGDVEATKTDDSVPPKEPSIPQPNGTPVAGQESNEQLSAPSQAALDVPFIVQAPNGNWDFPYKEACEEASVMMVHHFYRQTASLTQDDMKQEIDSIIGWGDKRFGSFDTNAADTAAYFTEKLGYEPERVHVVYDMGVDDIKAALSRGIPVIVPAAGRELGNRYFQTPGPLYHMLVIIGYDKGEFITNDPGTKRGKGYRYHEQVLFSAIHDLTADIEQISTGRKAMILVTPAT